MSSESGRPGNVGHVKGMAAAVHAYTSRRGSVFPRLVLSVDYRDPKHIRLRTYDQDGRVADTLGANDIAEAIIRIGEVVRFGETMHARPMRRDIASPPSLVPGMSFRQLYGEFAIARAQFDSAATAQDLPAAQAALHDALANAVAVDRLVGQVWRPDGDPLGPAWPARLEEISGLDDLVDLFAAVRFVNFRLATRVVDEAHAGLPFGMKLLSWPESKELPTGPVDGDGDAAYRARLEGELVAGTLATMADAFAALAPLLESHPV